MSRLRNRVPTRSDDLDNRSAHTFSESMNWPGAFYVARDLPTQNPSQVIPGWLMLTRS